MKTPSCKHTHTDTQTHFPFLYLALFGQTDGYEKEGVECVKLPWFFNSQHLISKEQGGQYTYMCIYITQATEWDGHKFTEIKHLL